MNEALTRNELMDLCRRLGHDPERVSQIILEPTGVQVIYTHPIAEEER